MKKFLCLLTVLLGGISLLSSQMSPNAVREVTQFSGMVKDDVSEAPVPFAIVYVDKEKRGTVSTIDGFFSFAVAKGDIVVVKSLGYRPYKFQIPFDTEGNSYYRDLKLEREIYTLDTFTVYPMPKPHQLRQAIANLDIPDDMVELAKKTIEKSKLDELAAQTRYDGSENFNQYLKNQVQSYYHYGQPAPIKLFDVFSWAEFIKSLKKNKSGMDNTGGKKLPEF